MPVLPSWHRFCHGDVNTLKNTRFCQGDVYPVLREESQLRAGMFTDRLKGLRMSSVLLAVLLLSPVAGLVHQAYPACVPDHMENFPPILSQDLAALRYRVPGHPGLLSCHVIFFFSRFINVPRSRQVSKHSTRDHPLITT